MAATLNPVITNATLKNQKVSAGVNGKTVNEVWVVPSGNSAAFELANDIGDAHGTITTAKLQTRNREPIDGDSGSTVAYKYELTYAPNNTSLSGGWSGVGEEIKEGASNATDIPIEKHPILSDEGKAAARADGVDSYIAPQPTFTHRKYEDAGTFVFKESDLVEGVGRIADTGTISAAGLDSPSAGKWLLMDRSIRYNGDTVEISRTWQYAENGWDTSIYLDE
jgi:hypothetical protein